LVIIDCGFLRWCAVQLLQKLSIRASNGPDKLMRIVKQPVTRYLPLGARRIGMSYSAPKVVQLSDYVAAAGLSSTYVFVVCNRNNLIMKQGLWNIAISMG
jgi:rRNA small subunit pseudouridine methyltransferase Nep1